MSYLTALAGTRAASRILLGAYAISIALLGAEQSVAQETTPAPSQTYTFNDYWYGAFMAVAVVGWGVLILFFCLKAMKNNSGSIEEVSKPFIIIAVVVSALFVVNSSQAKPEVVAAAFGLFGSIVGYMFGRSSMGDSTLKKAPEANDDAQPKKPNAVDQTEQR